MKYIEQSIEDGLLNKDERIELKGLLDENTFSCDQKLALIRRAISLARIKAGQFPADRLLEWLSNLSHYIGSESWVSKAYFTPLHDVASIIITQILSAKESLDICVFTISDNRIARAIINQHKKGVKVRIITDDEKMYDYGSDIFRMAKQKIEVKNDNSPSHMHHKFAIIDNKVIITGSYNWTTTASSKNLENVIVSRNRKLITSYHNEFNRLWDLMKSV